MGSSNSPGKSDKERIWLSFGSRGRWIFTIVKYADPSRTCPFWRREHSMKNGGRFEKAIGVTKPQLCATVVLA
jgi:hypothetical protein